MRVIATILIILIYHLSFSQGIDSINKTPIGDISHFNEAVFSTIDTINGISVLGSTDAVSEQYCKFDGIDDYITTGYNVTVNSFDSLTIAFWINLQDIDSTYLMNVLNTSTDDLRIRMGNSSFLNKGKIYMEDAWSASARTDNVIVNLGWVHVAYCATSQGSYLTEIYINGSDDNVGSNYITPEFLAGYATIGGDDVYLEGGIDNFLLYSRKLTSTNIAALYGDGTPWDATVDPTEIAGCEIYYKFNDDDIDGSADIIDHSGNDRHGTSSNMSTNNIQDHLMNNEYFAFDGGDAYISYNSEANDKEIEDDFTLAFWFRPHDGYTGSQYLSTRGAGNFIKFPVVQYVQMRLNTQYDTIYHDASMANDTWYHLAYVRGSDDTIREYLNGVEQADNCYNNQDYKFQFFGTDGAAYEEFDIDEIILCDTNITQAQIDSISAFGSSKPQFSHTAEYIDNLVWYWKMGDDPNDTHTDMIDQGSLGLDLDVNNAILTDIKEH